MPYLAPMLRSIALRSGPALATALALACGAAAMRSLAADGAPVTLKTTQIGEGPALVFVPDAGLGRTVWMPTARKLLAGHRIVLVDLPGHGESPMLDPFTLPAAAEALDQVLARLNGDSTIVIGQGVGGVIAAFAAKAHPDHLRGIVLIDVGMRAPMKIEDQQRQMFLRFMTGTSNSFWAWCTAAAAATPLRATRSWRRRRLCRPPTLSPTSARCPAPMERRTGRAL